jgi:hypothetical protein
MLIDDGKRIVLDPCGEFLIDGIPPLLRLAVRFWNRAVSREFRDQFAHVIGDVDVLGKPADNVIGLGKGSAAFEDEMLAEVRREQRIERPDDPNVLLHEMDGPPRGCGGNAQSFEPVLAGQGQVVISHATRASG